LSDGAGDTIGLIILAILHDSGRLKIGRFHKRLCLVQGIAGLARSLKVLCAIGRTRKRPDSAAKVASTLGSRELNSKHKIVSLVDMTILGPCYALVNPYFYANKIFYAIDMPSEQV